MFARRKRTVPQLNATSTADISFMLLIFFLVTTSMDLDKGLARKLPPMEKDKQEESVVNKENIIKVYITGDNKIIVDDVPSTLEELKNKLDGSGVKVERTGEGEIKLTAPENITFDTNSSVIKSRFTGSLNSVADVLKKYPDSNIVVSGHTDSTGNDSINNPLSVNRAAAVKAYLVGAGVAGSRVTSVGYGSKQPVASNSTANGRAQNRRVEIKIVAKQ